MSIPSRQAVDLVTTYLRHRSDGVPFQKLVTKLSELVSATEIALALAQQVNAGRIRYGYNTQHEEERTVSSSEDGRLLYHHASNYGLVPVSRDDSDAILEYLVERCTREAAEQNFTFDLTRVSLAQVYEQFYGKMPLDGIGFALDQLRQDGLVQFHVYGHNGYALLSVAENQKYTVVSRDLRHEGNHWFHVYAGSEQAALSKVDRHQLSVALELQGVALGWVAFKPLAGSAPVIVERV